MPAFPGRELEEHPFQVGALGGQLVQLDAGARGRRAPTVGGVDAGDQQGAVRRRGDRGRRRPARRSARPAAGCAPGPARPCAIEPSTSSTGPCRISWPAAMITTSSASSCISESRWLETSTVRPSRGERLEQVAHPADALGVEAVGRLVEDQHPRVAEHRGGDAEPLPHAQRVALELALGRRGQPDQRQRLVGPRCRAARRRAQITRRWLTAGAALVRAGRLQHRADVPQRLVQVGVALAADGRRAGGRA